MNKLEGGMTHQFFGRVAHYPAVGPSRVGVYAVCVYQSHHVEAVFDNGPVQGFLVPGLLHSLPLLCHVTPHTNQQLVGGGGQCRPSHVDFLTVFAQAPTFKVYQLDLLKGFPELYQDSRTVVGV